MLPFLADVKAGMVSPEFLNIKFQEFVDTRRKPSETFWIKLDQNIVWIKREEFIQEKVWI